MTGDPIKAPATPFSGAWPRLMGQARALALSLTLGATAALAPAITVAQAPSKDQPSTPEVEQRLKGLSDELRCLVCQNQTLADSHADLAIDLRNQVRTLVGRGMSDDEVKRYLVERYGDFVLYRPPVQGTTWLLWFGPFALLAVGGGVWVAVSRRSRRRSEPASGPAGITPTDARKLLGE